MKRNGLGVLVAGVVLLGAARPARAHHSFAAVFDANQPVTVQGVVAEVRLENPHSWFFIDVKGASGKVERWGFEASTPTSLLRSGVKPGFIKTGDTVTTGISRQDASQNAGARGDRASRWAGVRRRPHVWWTMISCGNFVVQAFRPAVRGGLKFRTTSARSPRGMKPRATSGADNDARVNRFDRDECGRHRDHVVGSVANSRAQTCCSRDNVGRPGAPHGGRPSGSVWRVVAWSRSSNPAAGQFSGSGSAGPDATAAVAPAAHVSGRHRLPASISHGRRRRPERSATRTTRRCGACQLPLARSTSVCTASASWDRSFKRRNS